MAHLYHNCQQVRNTSGQCGANCLARQARFYRRQAWLASVVGVLTLAWVLSASPRQEVSLKSIQAQTLTVLDELVVSEVCEMNDGKDSQECRNGKVFHAQSRAGHKLNSPKAVITCLLCKGATKLRAALS